MPLDHWLAFVAASAVLLAIPGPTVVLIISYALGHGRRAAGSTVAGVALGDFTAMTASLLGLGALLAASATLFTVLKWVGAAYLIYLGVKLWRAPVAEQAADVEAPVERHGRIFLHAYAVTALNPKSILFFVAFLPQFLDRSSPVPAQLLICEATFLVLATLNAFAYALLASAARRTIRRPGVQRVVNRTGGGLLIGAGTLAVAWRR
jgi:threonine/homoserine/homoserine lactone efflux protein